MEKKKAVMKIESFSHKDGTLLLSVSDWGVRAMLKGLADLCMARYGGYVKLEMTPPYKPRTTGDKSQNNKIWQMLTELSKYSGHDIEDLEEYVKLRAVKRGYPYRTNTLTGEIKPASMATINTVEASYLIEELYQIASEIEYQFEE